MTPESAAASNRAARAAGWFALTWNSKNAGHMPRISGEKHPYAQPLSADQINLLRLIASRSATDNIDAREAGLEKTRDTLAETFRKMDRNGLIERCGKGVRGRYRTTLWRITDAGRAYLAKEEGK
jgi:hypothetical protein